MVCRRNLRALKALVNELDLAQLSANNRQELSRMRGDLAQKQEQLLDGYLRTAP